MTYARFLAAILIVSLGSCQVSYLTQAMAGHFRIMNSRKPVEKILETDKVDQASKNKLLLALEIRDFAIRELSLPENKSYTVYSEIKGEYPGWNVYAAPEFSVIPKTWCFPIAGCVVYHGYFKKEKAVKFANKLEDKGFDVYIAPFGAYSTLGYYNDPILSNHLRYDSIRLAELIIHELAHQRFYDKGNSQISEGFAVTVERAGVLRWLESLERPDQAERAKISWDRDDRNIERILKTRNELNEVYLSGLDTLAMVQKKDSMLTELSQDLYNGHAELNNAYLIPVSTYHQLVPEFQSILDSCGGNFSIFYKEVEALSKAKLLMKSK